MTLTLAIFSAIRNRPPAGNTRIQSAALHFIPKEEMTAKGYEKYLPLLDKK